MDFRRDIPFYTFSTPAEVGIEGSAKEMARIAKAVDADGSGSVRRLGQSGHGRWPLDVWTSGRVQDTFRCSEEAF